MYDQGENTEQQSDDCEHDAQELRQNSFRLNVLLEIVVDIKSLLLLKNILDFGDLGKKRTPCYSSKVNQTVHQCILLNH